MSCPHTKVTWLESPRHCARVRGRACHDADLLIRHLERIAKGQARSESILEVQELYDNYFEQAPLWQR